MRLFAAWLLIWSIRRSSASITSLHLCCWWVELCVCVCVRERYNGVLPLLLWPLSCRFMTRSWGQVSFGHLCWEIQETSDQQRRLIYGWVLCIERNLERAREREHKLGVTFLADSVRVFVKINNDRHDNFLYPYRHPPLQLLSYFPWWRWRLSTEQ